jgi:hypothetical protein
MFIFLFKKLTLSKLDPQVKCDIILQRLLELFFSISIISCILSLILIILVILFLMMLQAISWSSFLPYACSIVLHFSCEHMKSNLNYKSSLQETQALPRVYDFAEGFLSGPRQRKSLPRATLGTAILTTLQPLSRVGPSAGWDLQHNQVFAEGQRSARSAPSEKERAPSHLGCRPLCRRL